MIWNRLLLKNHDVAMDGTAFRNFARRVFTSQEKPREEEDEEETRELCAGDSRNVSVPANRWQVMLCGRILSDPQIGCTLYVRGDLKRKRRFITPHDR